MIHNRIVSNPNRTSLNVSDKVNNPSKTLPSVSLVQKVSDEETHQLKKGIAQLVEEEEMQMKSDAVQFEKPEEELQMKSDIAQLVEEEELTQKKEANTSAKVNATGMPDQLKAGVENLSGMDLSDVKVHYNSDQPAQLNALAYAQGSDIHIGPGQEKHLPHEAWHVVQQRQGRVQATKQMKMGVAVNDDPALEHEADVMGEKAMNSGLVQEKRYSSTHNT